MSFLVGLSALVVVVPLLRGLMEQLIPLPPMFVCDFPSGDSLRHGLATNALLSVNRHALGSAAAGTGDNGNVIPLYLLSDTSALATKVVPRHRYGNSTEALSM